MAEQNKARPFVIGDFVIIKIGDHKSFTRTICDVDCPYDGMVFISFGGLIERENTANLRMKFPPKVNHE